MNRFWSAVLEPLLLAVKPAVIVEIGCERGANTRNLAAFCADHGCRLHVIDPAPALDPHELARWTAQTQFGFTLHKSLSLEVLPKLERVDVVLVDGDHNWYTVFHELHALEQAALSSDGKPPLIVLHDVGWPYGRRDAYHDPAKIPDEYRQPFGCEGLQPGERGLAGQAGFNQEVHHAVHEGGARNGVLTAVEDFIASSQVEYRFVAVPILHGLGILCPAALAGWNEELAQLLDRLPALLHEGKLLETIESERIRQAMGLTELHRHYEAALQALADSSDELDESNCQVRPALGMALETLNEYASEESMICRIEEELPALFRSWRWRLGNSVVNIVRKLLGMRQGQELQASLSASLSAWRERRTATSRKHQSLASAVNELLRDGEIEFGSATPAPRVRPVSPRDPTEICRAFHRLYYTRAEQTWRRTHWLGTPVLKCPLDLWIYQEIISRTKPDLIVETGTYAGGSGLFMASVCDLVDNGEVLTIDPVRIKDRLAHPRLRYLDGSSVDPAVLSAVKAQVRSTRRVMVVLDSDHSYEHVLAELRAYAPFVSQDCFLIVEDTNINGNPVLEDHGPGPREAVEAFLKENEDFVRDLENEKFFMTFNPGGYLRRVTVPPSERRELDFPEESLANGPRLEPQGATTFKNELIRLRSELAVCRQQQLIVSSYAKALTGSWMRRLLGPLHSLRWLVRSKTYDLRHLHPNEHVEQEQLAGPGTWTANGPEPGFTIPHWCPAGRLQFTVRLDSQCAGSLVLEAQYGPASDDVECLAILPIEPGSSEQTVSLCLERPALAMLLRPRDGLDRFRIEAMQLRRVPGLLVGFQRIVARFKPSSAPSKSSWTERPVPSVAVETAHENGSRASEPSRILPFEEEEYPVVQFLMEPSLDCSVIIPTINDVELVCQCVRSCREHLPIDARVEFIVVDDGTRDPAIRRALAEAGEDLDFDVHFSFQNLGFSAAVNLGMMHSRGRFLLLCNNDIVFFQPWLEAMKVAFAEGRKVGIVGARLLYPDGLIQHAGIEKVPNALGWVHRFKGQLADHGPANEDADVWGVTGALMAFRRETVQRLGGLSTAFSMAHEDVDYCLHAWTRGLRVRYQPSFAAYHLEGATRGTSPKERCIKPWFWAERDRLGWAYLARKWSMIQGVTELRHFLELCRGQRPPMSAERAVPISTNSREHQDDPVRA